MTEINIFLFHFFWCQCAQRGRADGGPECGQDDERGGAKAAGAARNSGAE